MIKYLIYLYIILVCANIMLDMMILINDIIEIEIDNIIQEEMRNMLKLQQKNNNINKKIIIYTIKIMFSIIIIKFI